MRRRVSNAVELHEGQTACGPGYGQWYVFRPDVSSWRLVCAPNAERAMKKYRGSTSARPVRPSSYWQQLRDQGLMPKMGRRRRK